ncbi:MAG TPA: type II toxin-antitoxin system RelE/ParE family toxin [Rhizomicrobium sp.]|jgi:phage-related protein|nr:type II toxin-antitoxin system RelE/ParE family toxin [Rhizomicrobium sp.]
MADLPKLLRWRGSSKADFMAFPINVQKEMGYALYLAQMGERHAASAKTLSGFHGSAVVEVRQNDPTGTFRAVYTVRFRDAVYVLHAFQKKSKRGISTPKTEMDIVAKRLGELVAEKAS